MRGVQTGRCGGARPGEGEGLVVGEADGQQIPCSDAAPHRRHLGQHILDHRDSIL